MHEVYLNIILENGNEVYKEHNETNKPVSLLSNLIAKIDLEVFFSNWDGGREMQCIKDRIQGCKIGQNYTNLGFHFDDHPPKI